MAGFCDNEIACNGSLDVGVGLFPLNCTAWDIVNFAPLWTGQQIVGENLVLPRITGSRPLPRRLAESTYNLLLWVRGDVDKDGNEYADHWQGLWENLEVLWLNVTSPVDTGDGTRPCTLTLPNGVTQLVADCQFEPLKESTEVTDPLEAIYTLTLTVPAGRFEPVGS
jgi:hypothetical protein